MKTVTISHNAKNGTLLQGTERDDGTYEVMRTVEDTVGHWKWSRSLGQWIVRNSRDRQPDQYVIAAAAAALRDAGFDVQMHIDRTARPTAVAEADRAERQTGRVQVLQAKASRKDLTAAEAAAAHDRACRRVPPGGEPVKLGHHSQAGHERALENVPKALSRSVQADRDAARAHDRAEAAAQTTDLRNSPRTVADRIETFEADQRSNQRLLDRYSLVLDADDMGTCAETYGPVTEEDRQRVVDRMAQRADEITYWKQVRAQQIAGGLTLDYGPTDFNVGDFVQISQSRWHQVTRANPKSVSVVSLPGQSRLRLYTITAKQLGQREISTDATVRYHHITGHMTEAQARERFPDLFTDLDAVTLPARPKRRAGTVKLGHRRGPLDEFWNWKLDGLEYEAVWTRPDSWYVDPPEPVTDPGILRVSAQRRTPERGRGEPVTLPVTDFTIAAPVHWPEEVHNQVRAIVEARAYLPAT